MTTCLYQTETTSTLRFHPEQNLRRSSVRHLITFPPSCCGFGRHPCPHQAFVSRLTGENCWLGNTLFLSCFCGRVVSGVTPGHVYVSVELSQMNVLPSGPPHQMKLRWMKLMLILKCRSLSANGPSCCGEVRGKRCAGLAAL